MSTFATVVVVVGALATVLLVAFVLLVQVQRVKRAYTEATRAIERLQPALDEIADQQAVTTRELARVSGAMEVLRTAREARRAP